MIPDTTDMSKHIDHRMYNRNNHLSIIFISLLYRQTDPLK